jgi:hypothetical protein
MTLPFPLTSVTRVEFFKRDELTSDLICCELLADDRIAFFHEEMPYWYTMIAELEKLDGFRAGWIAAVSSPPFAESRFVAYEKARA